MAVPLNYSLRSVWVRRSTTIATVAGVALVVFVLAASQMLVAGLRGTLGASGSADKAIVLQQNAFAEPNSRLSQATLNLAAAAPGVQKSGTGEALVTGESVVHAMLSSTEDRERIVSVFVRGVSPNVLALRPYVRVVQGRAPNPGTDEAMVGSRLFGRYEGLVLGGGIELAAGRMLRVVGVFEARGSSYESEVWTDLDAVRNALSWQGSLSSVTVQLASATEFDAFASEVTLRTSHEATAERESDYYRRISGGLARLIAGLGGVVAVVFSLGAMLGAAITMYGAVAQRTKEIGVFRALGFRRQHILAALLIEASAVALLGSAVGLGLALATSLVELATMNAATGAQIALRFEPTPGIIAVSIVAGTCVGLVGGLFPALKAARLDPIEAIRS